jgi:glycosyltransferase involved in cell wall biosynthesis
MSNDAVRETPGRLPKVSVCVITYNQERYIRKCLQSLVEQQTNFDFEIIVGDDCSTDGTRAVVQEFVERYPHIVRPLYQPKNTGGSRNNLEVHAAARGDYVAHVDGDDYTLPGKLQMQADLLDRDPACNAVWHRVDYFDDEGAFCSGNTADLSSFENGRVIFSDAIQLGFIGVYSSLMYRRSARSPVDASRRILDVHLTWDLLSKKGHGAVIDAVLGRYRIASSGSLTASSGQAVRLLAIEHADEYLKRHSQHGRDFMLWALCNAIVDAKNRRPTAFKLLGLAWRARSPLRFSALFSNLRRMRSTQVRWRQQRQAPQQQPGTESR